MMRDIVSRIFRYGANLYVGRGLAPAAENYQIPGGVEPPPYRVGG